MANAANQPHDAYRVAGIPAGALLTFSSAHKTYYAVPVRAVDEDLTITADDLVRQRLAHCPHLDASDLYRNIFAESGCVCREEVLGLYVSNSELKEDEPHGYELRRLRWARRDTGLIGLVLYGKVVSLADWRRRTDRRRGGGDDDHS